MRRLRGLYIPHDCNHWVPLLCLLLLCISNLLFAANDSNVCKNIPPDYVELHENRNEPEEILEPLPNETDTANSTPYTTACLIVLIVAAPAFLLIQRLIARNIIT